MDWLGYNKYQMKVYRGHGSLVVTLPKRLCSEEGIMAGDEVVFHKADGRKTWSFFKHAKRKKTVAAARDASRKRISR